jgi:ATP-dependent DNA helicase RecQ
MNMDKENLVFFDTEVNPQTGAVIDIGAADGAGRVFHSPSKKAFADFLRGAAFVCGHNAIRHDLKFVGDCLPPSAAVIDTLPLSPLLFPRRPYHNLVKDDKLISDELNNPVSDALKAKALFDDEIAAWTALPREVRELYAALLADQPDFAGFYKFLECRPEPVGGDGRRQADFFNGRICAHAPLEKLAAERPVELAYAFALLGAGDCHSITPPWVLWNHPAIERVSRLLTATPCLEGCAYCRSRLDPRLALKRHFGYDAFRTYAGEPLQENAARAAVAGRSMLVLFPTGGGKSITFQVPALLAGEVEHGLTVVISPLQSLMKDQVDNLEKADITEAVAINGLLDPIERAKAIERVADGSASILYISPESLRSRTIENLLAGRTVVRFVIDEAHCFSAWGQDFRPDYLYIGRFIRELSEKKRCPEPIPVSCFTATAKHQVVEDICEYFRQTLGLRLEVFAARSGRTNLHYVVVERSGDEAKYEALRSLIAEKNCPAIVYAARTKRVMELARRLADDGFAARPYHGQMDKAEKTENQNLFMAGDAQVIVATSAFGMGVDKKNVGLVAHFEISDSLESYVQEAGRAGRDENINAECHILFNEDDLNKHFILLNQTRLSIKEIKQVWSAIKLVTRNRDRVQHSALEIARQAGWDDSVRDIETRVTTAVTALEESGYLRRGQNAPRIFASSINCRSMAETSVRIGASARFIGEAQRRDARRMMSSLFSARSRKDAGTGDAESRVDYLCDRLGIVPEHAFEIIRILREEKILADAKDLTAFINQGDDGTKAQKVLAGFASLERFLAGELREEEQTLNIKELNERALAGGCSVSTPARINTVFNYWTIKHLAKKANREKNTLAAAALFPPEKLIALIDVRLAVASAAVRLLCAKKGGADGAVPDLPVEFSVLELVGAFNEENRLLGITADAAAVEDALFYLTRIGAMKIEGGFLVIHNKMTLERLEKDPRSQYKKEDYGKLEKFYENRVLQIHIVGEYAKKMLDDYAEAQRFVTDYFGLNFPSFLNKYFSRARQSELRRNITPKKYRELFDTLTETQRRIIDDRDSRVIVVAAGPGSGKTKVLVHKLAALLLMEDVKHEQLLMLTFSRAAATEFKARLIALIGNAANFVEIKTFHSYCFDILGRVGTLGADGPDDDGIVAQAVAAIRAGEIEPSRMLKSVLVIDEAQDMDASEAALVKAMMDRNDGLRVIAVGDDDQSIYGFRGADPQYFSSLLNCEGAKKYELSENFRACPNLVAFTNQFAATLSGRLKSIPIEARRIENGFVRVVTCTGPCLVEPLVAAIQETDLKGTTGVLTRSNSDAAAVAAMLRQRGFPVQLAQENSGFALANLQEVRFFTEQVSRFDSVPAEEWEEAKRKTFMRFRKGNGTAVVREIIASFETANPARRYLSDLRVFLRESRLEDFTCGACGETIAVSTMHKAKGREFDNVFLAWERMSLPTAADRRLLYVAMTRAKCRLDIFTDTPLFASLSCDGLARLENRLPCGEPDELPCYLTHRELNLGYFKFVQARLESLAPASPLVPNGDGIADEHGCSVLKFSKRFTVELEERRAKGYVPVAAAVNFFVWWKDKESGKEHKILLPEITLRKTCVVGQG